MADFVAPVARSVFLCFHVTDAGGGKVHLGWVFDVIRADAYPWTQAGICVVMQLSDGLGPVPLSLSMGRLSDGLDEEEDLQLLLEMEPTIIHFEIDWNSIESFCDYPTTRSLPLDSTRLWFTLVMSTSAMQLSDFSTDHGVKP